MSESVKKTYDERAEEYEKTIEKNFYKICDVITWKYLKPYLPKSRKAVVLDAGGGTGRWSIPMAKMGLNIVLVDISGGMLNVARRKIKKAGYEDKITIKKGDITKLEYPDETFDLVFCEHVIFLIEEPVKAIQELGRVLKKGCPLIISYQNVYVGIMECLKSKDMNSIMRVLNADGLIRIDRRQMEGIGRGTTPTEFRKMLVENGFEVEKIVGKGVTITGLPVEYLFGNQLDESDFFRNILKIELTLCEKRDALGLAGHLQAVAYKK